MQLVGTAAGVSAAQCERDSGGNRPAGKNSFRPPSAAEAAHPCSSPAAPASAWKSRIGRDFRAAAIIRHLATRSPDDDKASIDADNNRPGVLVMADTGAAATTCA
ncbi:MAG: hypothetical protein WDW38_001169 [Sanguina aurantia]